MFQVTKLDADKLCLSNTLWILGVDNRWSVGAAVNIVNQNGMKAKLQKELSWRCTGHGVMLARVACKGAFSSQLFRDRVEVWQR